MKKLKMILLKSWKCCRNTDRWILCLSHGRAGILYSDRKFAEMLLTHGLITEYRIYRSFLAARNDMNQYNRKERSEYEKIRKEL